MKLLCSAVMCYQVLFASAHINHDVVRCALSTVGVGGGVAMCTGEPRGSAVRFRSDVMTVPLPVGA
jgi:hypothetical protein